MASLTPAMAIDKENCMPSARSSRKSMGSSTRRKSVSFGVVSVHEFDKVTPHGRPSLDMVPEADGGGVAESPGSSIRRSPRISACQRAENAGVAPPRPATVVAPIFDDCDEDVTMDMTVAIGGIISSNRSPAPPPESSPEMPAPSAAAKARPSFPLASPSMSEASDVFFSPAESFASARDDGTPPGENLGTPSLSGLLFDDERDEEVVPALSQLLEADQREVNAAAQRVDDENDTTMDMTVAVGGILSRFR